MRLIRFGAPGRERPGLLRQGRIVDLTAVYPEIPDIGEDFFAGGWMQKAAAVTDPGREMAVRLGCPLQRTFKIICLGLNYREHKAESGMQQPQQPLLFAKAPSALNGPYDPIVLPRSSGKVDWEVELAVIIGRTCKRVAAKDAFDCIAGFAVMNDVSGREAQFADSQWFRGKSFDTFAPLGPAIVTADEIGDVQQLHLSAAVNGETMQDGTTADMIFDVATLVEYISEDITLMPGDVIATGTPAGVGIFRDPPRLLAPGDVVRCRIENIGELENRVAAE